MADVDVKTSPKVDYSPEAVKRLVQRCVTDAKNNSARLNRDKQDLKNLMFYRGGEDNQWIVWDAGTNSWVRRPYDGPAGLPEWAPRATTNYFAREIDGVCSILDESDPAQEWKPATTEDRDLATAEVARDAIPVLLEEIDDDTLRQLEHKLIALTNGCAIVYYYDNDESHGFAEIQLLRCTACNEMCGPADADEAGGVCPSCGADGEALEDAYNERFEPLTTEFPRGKLCAHVIPSFEYTLPRTSRLHDETKVPWVLTHARYTKEDALRWWGKDPRAGELIRNSSGTVHSPLQRHFADQMARLSSPHGGGIFGTVTGKAIFDGPVIYQLYHDPIADQEVNFPDGLYAVILDDEVIEAGPLPYKDEKGRPFKNVILRTYQRAPGAQFGKPPADDLVPVQIKFNKIEMQILLILMHDAVPRTFIPTTVTLEDEPDGSPGQNIRYRTVQPGDKPMTDRGVSPPEGLYKYLEIVMEQFHDLSGLNAVLLGQQPSGQPTLGEVETLKERGMATFKAPLDNLVSFEKRQARMILRIARQTAWAPRFLQVRGENGQWDVKQFTAADLDGNVDVQIEPTTAWPKSPLMEQLKLEKLIEAGVLQPGADPELQVKLLSQYGLTKLKPSLDVDTKQIMRELDRWRQGVVTPPEPAAQNLKMHLHYKQQFLKTEEAEAMKHDAPQVYQAMLQHVQMLEQLLNPAPPPAAAAGPDGSAVDAAVKSGALRPAAAPGQALNHAVASGALKPAGGHGDVVGEAIKSGAIHPARPAPPMPPPMPAAPERVQ